MGDSRLQQCLKRDATSESVPHYVNFLFTHGDVTAGVASHLFALRPEASIVAAGAALFLVFGFL